MKIEKIESSLKSLIKFNNGAFKSIKQRDFLRSACVNMTFYGVKQSVYGNSFRAQYMIDDLGVYKAIISYDSGKEDKVIFERLSEKEHSANVQIHKQVAVLNEIHKGLFRRIEELSDENENIMNEIIASTKSSKISSDDLLEICKQYNKTLVDNKALIFEITNEIDSISKGMGKLSSMLRK